ncbi:FAD dependent oxidoreductase [Hypoxylon trugodes]|uniref:FAD dependent oxidoreductase n=1 Tax=Hypoxylon trugodes TaxID=326681 RepID=UPI00219A4665|nr:FAD dependent oxidoreductase [Hypoxylon trugodes]KAI1383133.1 FAD dependent oxidoreductase [Hypoxylon trugodes]
MLARTARRQFRPENLASLTRSFSSTAPARADFTHVVIGGGVVGLAISRALSQRTSSTLLLERHTQIGTETSSRNSEVIHAGLYYGSDSLKTRLCISGRQALYKFCEEYKVPYAKVGKWVVAQDDAQRETLERIHRTCKDEIGVPTRWVGKEEARREEPCVTADSGVLESPETGIVDSHSLMATLHGHFEEEGGFAVLNSTVVGIEPLNSTSGSLPGSGGWRLRVLDAQTNTESDITTETIINSAGLGAAEVHNMIVPPERRTKLYYAKGNYFSYASSKPKVRRLIYPVAAPGAGGLGTHLTLDLSGRMRFGPDVEWVDSPDQLSINASRLPDAITEIKKYLPEIDTTALAPDYAGIRPKLRPASARGFVDFYIRKEDGYEGWVNLLGIESPGLTSSLAIGDLVRDIFYASGKVEGSPPLQ